MGVIQIQRLEGSRSPGWSYVFSIGLLRVVWIVEVVLRTAWVGRDCGLCGYRGLEVAADGS